MVSDRTDAGLLIDVGNSHTRVAVWRRGDGDASCTFEDGRLASWTGHPLQRIGSWPTMLNDPGTETDDDYGFWLALKRAGDLPMVLTSVVPQVTERVQKSWPTVILANHSSELPFEVAVEDVKQVGADRLCNLAAAAMHGLTSAIVVDVGTATTVDVLVKGVFVGGLIAPGMASAGASLSAATAQLPIIAFEDCELSPGRDTSEAMARGVFHAGRGGVEALITGMRAQFGSLPVVLTGGLGEFLNTPNRLYDSDWTFRGAAALARLR